MRKICWPLLVTIVAWGCVDTPDQPDDDDDSIECVQGEFFFDADADGWGGESTVDCEAPAGSVEEGGDCDDEDPAVHPGADEICDGLDTDCDGVLGDDELDADADGWPLCLADCDDDDPDLHPGDLDSDGFSPCGGDCNDGMDTVFPGAEQLCDSWLDNDCDGEPDRNEWIDEDGDTYNECAGDCDDVDPEVNPGATEECDGVESDCDPTTDDYGDLDADGVAWCEDDCNDLDPQTYPGAAEQCDGADNDCDGTVDEDLPSPILVPSVCPTLPEALAVTPDGGTIHVQEGLHLGTVVVAQPVSIIGVGGAILDGQQLGVTLTVAATEGVLLEGLTVTGGLGAGIAIEDSVVEMAQLIVDSNDGVGVLVVDSEVSGHHLRLASNVGVDGGGLAAFDSELLLDWVVVAGNSAAGPGGGIYLEDCETTLSQSALVSNESGGGGGGIAAVLGELEIRGSVLWGNSAATGGGVYAEPPVNPDVELAYCNVQGNTPDAVVPDLGFPDDGDGNFSTPPAFLGVVGEPFAWDLHVSTSSPNVDASDPGLLDPDATRSDVGPFGAGGAAGWDLDGDGFPSWWQPGPYNPAVHVGLDCDDLDPAVFPGSGC